MSGQRDDNLATVENAMREMQPILSRVSEFVMTCPLPAKEKGAFATLVAGHFIGVALAALELDCTPGNVRALSGYIADAMLSEAMGFDAASPFAPPQETTDAG